MNWPEAIVDIVKIAALVACIWIFFNSRSDW